MLSNPIVCSPDKLAEALTPLMKGRSAPFTFTVPAVPRETGGWTKSFPFVVALSSVMHLLPADASALFPDKYRKELHDMSAQQIVAYQAWSEAEKAAYASLYSKEEWEANVAECRRVYKATNKAANNAKKRKGMAPEDGSSTVALAATSDSSRQSLLLLCEAKGESKPQVTNPHYAVDECARASIVHSHPFLLVSV